MTNKNWKQFEIAVATFLAALDPSAKVTHDAYTPDADTGLPRQRDVWIETHFGGHFGIKILVSCKRKSSKLSQQDIDAFVGELRSSGAQKGVLYAYRGFTRPALAKAKALNISCCRLYENAAPELPEVIIFAAYQFLQHERLKLDPSPLPPGIGLSELFALPVLGDEATRSAVDALAMLWHADDAEVLARITERPLPRRHVSVTVLLPRTGEPAELSLTSYWIVHRAKLESWLVNGSYSITDGDFKGSAATPPIDLWRNDPAPGWEEIEESEMPATDNSMAFVRMSNNVAKKLLDHAREYPDIALVRPSGETR